ncbi:M23 family metallopeptidase (plasmid) [Micromonospora zamorensis]|uniref:M23 family metallopeptidase n=1 Tax=Micromonospora zamorensis TaxID=709883 RepID=UPI002E201AAA
MTGSAAWKWAAAGAVALAVVPTSLIMLGGAVVVAGSGYQCTLAPASTAGTPAASPDTERPQTGSWDAAQMANAAAIVRAGAEKSVPPRGWTIAVATAIQESGLRNLANSGVPESLALPNEGVGHDHDSVGLFQQRPGWGSVAQRMTPEYAAGKFYDALRKVDAWQRMSLTDAAQAVQVSGFPDAYAKWESEAEHLVQVARGQLDISCTSGGTGEWRLPLPEGSYDFGSPFGMRGESLHRGVDLIADTGTPVFAAAAGTVTSAECTSAYCDRPGSPDLPGCGLAIEIQHTGGIGTTYCHLVSARVGPGQRVAVGEEIGRVGSTGHSSAPHLHFQVHQSAPPISNETAVDAVPFLADLGLKF